jgi:2-polyprenyl-6-methoxyphenol hydroxylase-like FAD-dependent oxidoreductase
VKDLPVAKDEIREHIAGWYELLGAAVEAADPASIVQTEAWDLEPLDTWVDGRVVLLGDSAHATTPFASMGACMTIQDCRALVDRLVSDAPLEEALGTYQNARKENDEAVVRHSRRMGTLAMLHSPILGWLRDEAFSHMPEDKMRAVTEEMARGD